MDFSAIAEPRGLNPSEGRFGPPPWIFLPSRNGEGYIPPRVDSVGQGGSFRQSANVQKDPPATPYAAGRRHVACHVGARRPASGCGHHARGCRPTLTALGRRTMVEGDGRTRRAPAARRARRAARPRHQLVRVPRLPRAAAALEQQGRADPRRRRREPDDLSPPRRPEAAPARGRMGRAGPDVSQGALRGVQGDPQGDTAGSHRAARARPRGGRGVAHPAARAVWLRGGRRDRDARPACACRGAADRDRLWGQGPLAARGPGRGDVRHDARPGVRPGRDGGEARGPTVPGARPARADGRQLGQCPRRALGRRQDRRAAARSVRRSRRHLRPPRRHRRQGPPREARAVQGPGVSLA